MASLKHFVIVSTAALFISQGDNKYFLSIFFIVPEYNTFPELIPIFFKSKKELSGLLEFNSFPATIFKYGTGSNVVI